MNDVHEDVDDDDDDIVGTVAGPSRRFRSRYSIITADHAIGSSGREILGHANCSNCNRRGEGC